MSEEMKKDMLEALPDDALGEVAGGKGTTIYGKRIVSGLKTGWLALRTERYYDPKNEKRGHQLYNGDKVYLLEEHSKAGGDGHNYIKVLSRKDGATGYVNSSYLKRY